MVNRHDRHHQASSPVAWTWSGARDGCCPRPPRCPLTDAAAVAQAGRVARHQRRCLFIPGTEGPEEGPAPDPPQVRAASGAPHQERLGGSLQSRPAAAPGRPLAPPPRRPAGRRPLLDSVENTPCPCHTNQLHSESELSSPRAVGSTHIRLSSRSGVQTMVTPRPRPSWGPDGGPATGPEQTVSPSQS